MSGPVGQRTHATNTTTDRIDLEEFTTMAKISPATAPASKSTDLATADAAPLVGLTRDELAGVLDGLELGTDGLEEIGREDIRLSVKVWNFKGVDVEGNPIPANVFYDTVTEECTKTIDATLLTLHKSNEWREYDEAAGESNIHCKSYDQKVGTMADGTTRACEGCPDAEWKMVDGKRKRNCGPVYNVVGLDRLTQSAFIIRCKKTSLDPFKLYLNKHFLGRRIVGGKKLNYPLFGFQTRISLKMSDGKKPYAIPVFDKGLVLGTEEITAAGADALFYREHMMPALEKAEKLDTEKPDSSFDFGSNGGEGPSVFNADGGEAQVAGANSF